MLAAGELAEISKMVSGHGRYGALISGTVDLDNLDNVFRLSYHMGLVRSGDTPLRLARALRTTTAGTLLISDDALPLLEEWYQTRALLYRFLLLNADEFSAKCMLQEALERAQERSAVSFFWHDVDFELLRKLAAGSADLSAIVGRLMLGDLYGCIGIYATASVAHAQRLATLEVRRRTEAALEQAIRRLSSNALKKTLIRLHFITDVNKTERQVHARLVSGRKVTLGRPSHRVLIGIFFKNVHLSTLRLRQQVFDRDSLNATVLGVLERALGGARMTRLEPYAEANEAGTRS